MIIHQPVGDVAMPACYASRRRNGLDHGLKASQRRGISPFSKLERHKQDVAHSLSQTRGMCTTCRSSKVSAAASDTYLGRVESRSTTLGQAVETNFSCDIRIVHVYISKLLQYHPHCTSNDRKERDTRILPFCKIRASSYYIRIYCVWRMRFGLNSSFPPNFVFREERVARMDGQKVETLNRAGSGKSGTTDSGW